jgi:hypothetical protein
MGQRPISVTKLLALLLVQTLFVTTPVSVEAKTGFLRRLWPWRKDPTNAAPISGVGAEGSKEVPKKRSPFHEVASTAINILDKMQLIRPSIRDAIIKGREHRRYHRRAILFRELQDIHLLRRQVWNHLPDGSKPLGVDHALLKQWETNVKAKIVALKLNPLERMDAARGSGMDITSTWSWISSAREWALLGEVRAGVNTDWIANQQDLLQIHRSSPEFKKLARRYREAKDRHDYHLFVM